MIILIIIIFSNIVQGYEIYNNYNDNNNNNNVIGYMKYNDEYHEVLDILNNNNIILNNEEKSTNTLLIGGLGKYINITLQDKFRIIQKIHYLWGKAEELLSFEPKIYQYQKTNKTVNQYCYLRGFNEDFCKNYIRVIIPFKNESNMFFICGTNFYRPLCLKYNQIDRFIYNNSIHSGMGLCPFNPNDMYYLFVSVDNNNIFFSGKSNIAKNFISSIFKNTKEYTDFNNLDYEFIYSFKLFDMLYFFVNERVTNYYDNTYQIFGRLVNISVKTEISKNFKHDFARKYSKIDIFCKYLGDKYINKYKIYSFRNITAVKHFKENSIFYIAFSDDNIYTNVSSVLCEFSYYHDNNNNIILNNGKLLMLAPYSHIIGIERISNYLILCHKNGKLERYIIVKNTILKDDVIMLRKTVKDIYTIHNDDISLICILTNNNEIIFIKLLFSSKNDDDFSLDNNNNSSNLNYLFNAQQNPVSLYYSSQVSKGYTFHVFQKNWSAITLFYITVKGLM